MTTTIEIHDGQNLFQIKSDRFSDCFNIMDQISSIVWRTYYRYYAVSKEQNGIEFLKQSLPEFDAKNDKTKTLSAIKTFMKLFPNGKYKLTIQELTHGQYRIANNDLGFNKSHDEDNGHFTYCIYTESYLIAFTKPYEEINYELVEGYKYQILEEKKKPLIVVFNVSQYGEDSFIIDGHHKLLAYRDLCINPNILRITKIEPEVKLYKNLITGYKNIMNKSELKHYQRVTKKIS